MNSNITAVILSGGKSSRIGEDKALFKLSNLTLIERIYFLLNKLFNEVIIISNNPKKYEFLNTKIYKDIFPRFGPLSGIHSGLTNSNTNLNFFISCDMPFVSKELIEFLINIEFNEDILIPKSNNNIHSLCAVYKKSCLDKAERLLKFANESMNNETGKSKIKLFDLINSMHAKYVNISEENFFHTYLMFNMNTISDLEFVKNKLEK